MDHQHSFVRWKKQGKPPEMWLKCCDPHCTYIAPRSLLIGKASLCPQCKSREVILDHEALRRARPLCIECRNTKESKTYKLAKKLVETATSVEELSAFLPTNTEKEEEHDNYL
jgi:hypothetical protein